MRRLRAALMTGPQEAAAAFDVRDFDWDANVGSNGQQTLTYATAAAAANIPGSTAVQYKPTIGPGLAIGDASNAVFDESLGYLTPSVAAAKSTATQVAQLVATFTNCLVNTVIYTGNGMILLVNDDVFPTVGSQAAAGVEGGATQGSVTAILSDFGAIEDGSDPGGDWFAWYSRFGNAQPAPIEGKEWGGGMPGATNQAQSNFMPVADLKRVQPYVPGELVTQAMVNAGCFREIYPSNENNHLVYQVIAPGYVDSQGATAQNPAIPYTPYYTLKASDTTQPFIITGGSGLNEQVNPASYSGTQAILICVGSSPHADGLQMVAAHRVRARRCNIGASGTANPHNSAFFMQSAYAGSSPITNASLEECWVFGGESNKWAVVEGTAYCPDPNGAAQPGGYYRDPNNSMFWTPWVQGQVYTFSSTLSSPLSTTAAINKLLVNAFPVFVQQSHPITVTSPDGTHTQTFTAPATGTGTQPGAVNLPVQSQTPTFGFPIGSTVSVAYTCNIGKTRPRGARFLGNKFDTLSDGVTYPASLKAACIDGGPAPIFVGTELAYLTGVINQYQLASGSGAPFVETPVGTTALPILLDQRLQSLVVAGAGTTADIPAGTAISVTSGSTIQTFYTAADAPAGSSTIPLTAIPLNVSAYPLPAGATISFGDESNIMHGVYDWATLDANIAAGTSSIIVNQTTLNQRKANGIDDGACDARTWVRAAGNTIASGPNVDQPLINIAQAGDGPLYDALGDYLGQ